MNRKQRIIQYGVGPIGIKMVQYLAERASIEIVGAVDIDPIKAGRDLGELAGLAAPLGVEVSSNASEVLRRTDADAVVLTTSSSLESIAPQVMEIVSFGKNIVSSCEELSFPWLTRHDIAVKIDNAAKKNHVSVLSTGVNPGFVMDLLPLVISGVCREVKSVTVERFQDAGFRRLPFQKKIGAGLSLEEFKIKADRGVLRHVGLTESIHMIASKLGWKLDRTEDVLSPVVSGEKLSTEYLTVEPGQASGVSQIGRGYCRGEAVITLVFKASVGEKDPRDRIVIKGTPDLDVCVQGGINGDIATCAIIANAIPVVVEERPGLLTMADVRPIPCSG